jgi:hypothetical protein
MHYHMQGAKRLCHLANAWHTYWARAERQQVDKTRKAHESAKHITGTEVQCNEPMDDGVVSLHVHRPPSVSTQASPGLCQSSGLRVIGSICRIATLPGIDAEISNILLCKTINKEIVNRLTNGRETQPNGSAICQTRLDRTSFHQ